MIERLIVFTFSGEGAALVAHAIAEGIEGELAIIEDIADTLTDAEQENSEAVEKPEEHKRRMSIGKGLMPTSPASAVVKRLRKMSAKELATTFLFFDLNVGFRFAEQLADLGCPGNYPTQDDRILEADREAGKAFVEKHYRQLKVAEHHEFTDVEEAVEFLEETEDLWVLKGYSIDAATVVPDTEDVDKAREQIRSVLEKRRESYESDGFLLERKIARVLEVTPQGVWYDGRLAYYSLDIELKRKGAGDTGLTVGCAANLIAQLDESDPIVAIAFPPVVRKMAREHQGMFVWDASVLIDPATGEMFYGEFCSNRCGYDALFTEIEMSGGVRSYFDAIVAGRNPLSARAGFAVRVFNDHDDSDEPKMVAAGIHFAIEPAEESHAWILDGRQEDDELVTNGYIQDLVVVTGAGPDPMSAIAATYRTLERAVSFEGGSYRPMHDITATVYPGAIMNRFHYGRQHGLFAKPDEDARVEPSKRAVLSVLRRNSA